MGLVLSEPVVVPDEVVHGIAYVDELEPGTRRLTLYKKQRNTYDGESNDLILNVRLIASEAVLLQLAKAIMISLGIQCCNWERLRKLSN